MTAVDDRPVAGGALAAQRALHRPVHHVRIVTAAALFDGHDAAINIVRRLLQAQGAEVIHLGHNRSVAEIVKAAVEEDVQGVAVSSYQGGHVEFFRYLVDCLREVGRADIGVYGGGGGVIVPSEIEALEAYGVRRIFSPADGQRLGLGAMVNELIEQCDVDLAAEVPPSQALLAGGGVGALARVITAIESDRLATPQWEELRREAAGRTTPVLGITGTGGSGKSSLTDELVNRFRLDLADTLRIAVLATDPTRRRGGGALLGDRIRMNAIDGPQVYFRSFATRGAASEVPPAIAGAVLACKVAGYDLVILETPGIGQGDAAVTEIADRSLYVMTPEYGAPSQLEKIDMIELADAVAINKFDRPGAEDALRFVGRQLRRSRPTGEPPVFGTIAARFNDDGVTSLYQHLRDQLVAVGLPCQGPSLPPVTTRVSTGAANLVPAARRRYLAEIAETVRAYHLTTVREAAAAHRAQALKETVELAQRHGIPAEALGALVEEAGAELSSGSRALLREWPGLAEQMSATELPAGKGAAGDGANPSPLVRTSLSGTAVPRVALPRFTDQGELLRFLRSEHLPGHFPFTAGTFPLRRESEDPARMFAGEGDPARTNRRFHLLADGQRSTRLSTAFDSVTLYGFDPDDRPDVYGKIGTSGVSVATIEDMADLYAGFDLCDPSTSVSMTINGPAPAILAMYLNVAIDQQLEAFAANHGRSADEGEAETLRAFVLARVRGTVQADILKEDQGQNTCIFSTDFALKMMADIQQYFVDHQMDHFYSVSVSGYHIAEAGANPITQLAFTLANAFTYVEAYLARGMQVDDFAHNLSFFFSNGMDPEYTVIGRVARRIWAIAMAERYGASTRAQKLKYHIQTSGRSLHAQEMSFNDIRTTLQALCAIYDNANSLHTNAYDEAVTTPSAESVRRALAIQLVINREWGLAMNENPLQGSFVVEQLTDLVEEAVLAELERLDARGGVLGAMETGYQRGRIQDDSLLYEERKHDGSLPIVGVNTFLNPDGDRPTERLALSRSTEEEKQRQLARVRAFRAAGGVDRDRALADLRRAALEDRNVFEELMRTVRHASLGDITAALFEVGGRYRRNV